MNKSVSKILVLIIAGITIISCGKDEIGPTETCSCILEDSILKHPYFNEYQNLIDYYTSEGLPSISLLVRDDKGLWAGASGKSDITMDIDMKTCNISKIASITKLMVGSSIMKLEEEGILDLDKLVSEYLPSDVIEKCKNAENSTLRQLLNHTTGIYDVITNDGFYLEVLNDPAKHWTPDDLLNFVKGEEPVFETGTSVEYSNTNFLLAAMIVEAVTGKPHHVILREKIIDPLGMKDTYYYYHEPFPSFSAQGYFDLYDNGKIVNMTNYNTGSGNGYGGVYSTVFDLQVFIESLFRERTILQEETMDKMLEFTDIEYEDGVSNNKAYGLSVVKDYLERTADEYGLGHRGRDLGYSADAYYFPEKDITMIYLVNYGTDGNSSLKPVFFEFRDAVVDKIMELNN